MIIMVTNNFKKRIIDVLKKHHEGLMIMDVAENTGISRITVSKYILVMVAEGLVIQRSVGTAKLCYLN